MNSTLHKYLPHYTYDDYVQWEGQWELINGVPYSMVPMPTIGHQRLNGKILNQLTDALSDCDKCEAFMPVDWKLKDDTVFQPDVSVLCKPFEEGAYITKTPVIIFEILSPSSVQKDRNLKYEMYEEAGVKYYIIVHPLERKASLFKLVNGKYKLVNEFTTGVYLFETDECSFEFDFGKVW